MSSNETAVSPLISIIIPAYNEEQRLPSTLAALDEFVSLNPNHVLPDNGLELIIVDNASTDKTNEIAQHYAKTRTWARVIVETRRGKGAAVKTGMFAGTGKLLFICDADLAMPFQELPKFLPPKLTNYDIAIGSREGEGAKRYNEPSARHLQGRVATFLTKMVLGLPHEDTQCGYKCFKREVAHDIFRAQTIDKWGFDFEILYIAKRRGYKVVDVPIHWYYRDNSRVKFGIDAIKTLRELLHVRQNGLRGAYD
jgi:glycosyltransferase involved in cell wall biosynthesis